MSEESEESVREEATAGGGDVALGRHIRLFPHEPLPAFDRPTARAYAAQDDREAGRALFALVCGEDVLPRVDALAALARLRDQPLVAPLEWGLVDWPAAGARRLAIAFEQPAGKRLLDGPAARARPMGEDELVQRVLRPLLPLLRELSTQRLAHRAVSADNLYAGETGGPVVLGECASAPAGMLQPLVYETIEAGQAEPAGRGPGTQAEDLYAFGVLLAVLLLGGDPLAALPPYDILKAKIDKGSYAALLGDKRISLHLMEPLRGLLCDDPGERWAVGDLELWANGRSLSPKQAVLPTRARRPFAFAGTEHWNCRSLSMAMHARWDEALACLREGHLEAWVRRSLGDEQHARRLLRALGASGITPGASPESDDRLLTRVLAALDPRAPLRCRDLAARVEALPQVLAVGWHDEARRRRVAEAINARLPQQWLEAQPDTRAEYASLMQTFEKLRFFLGRPQIGYGPERCLYEFNPEWPCQSPLTRGRYVREMDALLPALEAAAEAGAGEREREPLDRHVAAFCAARIRPAPERTLQALADPTDEAARRLAVLRLLAEVQRRTGPPRTPHLAAWVAGLLEPAIETYHNRRFRERLREAVARAGEAGDLTRLVFLVDNIEARDRDTRGFHAAREDYARLEREAVWLEQGGLTSDAHVGWASRNASIALSALVSAALLVALTLSYVA